jgi:5'-nucleotidase / UDP-sugar diphosphatase
MRQMRVVSLTLALLVLAGFGLAYAEVIGKTTAPLDSQNVRMAESSLGNLLADAIAKAGGAPMALVQASQLRGASCPAGDLTREALLGMLLYPDEKVVVVDLTGAQFQAALERSLGMLPKPNTGFLQVSGLAATYKSSAPEGQRVVSVSITGQPLETAKVYRVAMPESLAKGGLGYFRIFNGLKSKDAGSTIGDALTNYVQTVKTVAPQTGRLRDLTPPEQKT